MSKARDPIILCVVLFLLALGAGLLAYYYPSVPDITGVSTLQQQGDQAQLMKADDIVSSLNPWNTPVVWNVAANHNRLFESDEYLFYASAYPNGTYIVKMGGDSISPSGIPLSWYKKYGLDFTDSNIDHEDPDGDGFSTIVEYRNDPVGTRRKAADCDPANSCNPTDPKSHPEYLSRLRLLKYETRPFHILFNGYQQLNGAYVFQLHLNDVPSYNQPPLLKTGDSLGFEGYVVGAFHQISKDETDPGTNFIHAVDESTLDLVKPEIGLTVTVPFRKEIDSPEYTANFVMLMPSEVDKVIKVSRGKIFVARFVTGRSFLVVEANDDGATIRDIKTKQEYHILKLWVDPNDPNNTEWNEVPQAAAAATPPAAH